MGIGAGLYMCDVVKKSTFAISSPDEFLSVTVLAMAPISICLTVTSQFCIKMAAPINLVFGTEATLGLLYTLCCKGIRVSPERRVFPSGTLSQTLDVEKFRDITSTIASVVNLV